MDSTFGLCYLHSMESPEEQARLGCEAAMVLMAIYFILKVWKISY